MVWELVFMMVILKLPIAYLCAVVWWAVRAEPRPLAGAAVGVPVEPDEPPDRFRRRAAGHGGPRRGPARGSARVRRARVARAGARR